MLFVVEFYCNVLCLLLLLLFFVKEGCRRIFPFSSFIVDVFSHGDLVLDSLVLSCFLSG